MPGGVRTGKGFPLFISDEDINDIIKIVAPLEKSGLLSDGAMKKWNMNNINTKVGLLLLWWHLCQLPRIASMAYLLIQPVASSLINAIPGKAQKGGFPPILQLSSMMKVLGKGAKKTGRGDINMYKIF